MWVLYRGGKVPIFCILWISPAPWTSVFVCGSGTTGELISIEKDDLDLLKYASERGIITIHDKDVLQSINMNERYRYLEQHEQQIWQGKDGQYYTHLYVDGKRVLKKRKTLLELENSIIEHYKEIETNPILDNIFNDWNDRRLELQKISLSTHARNRQVYNRYFYDFGKRKIKYVTKEDMADFLEEQIPKFNLTAKGFSNLKTIVRGFLKRAKKLKYIDWNISEMFDDLDVSDKEFTRHIKPDEAQIFTDSELPKMLKYLSENPDMHNLAILLMFVTGCRVGEIVALKWEDIEDYHFTVKRTETRYLGDDGINHYEVKDFPKTPAGYRPVLIPQDYQWIIDKLRNMNPNGEYIFSKGSKRFNTTMVRTRMYTVCSKLGFQRKSPHKARKTYASILLDNRLDNKMIQTQMGHTDIIMTESYYHFSRKSLGAKQAAIDAIPEFCLEVTTK